MIGASQEDKIWFENLVKKLEHDERQISRGTHSDFINYLETRKKRMKRKKRASKTHLSIDGISSYQKNVIAVATDMIGKILGFERKGIISVKKDERRFHITY